MGRSLTTFGILLMMMADVLIISMGAFAKGLGEEVTALEIAFYKSIIALVGVTLWLIYKRQWSHFRTQNVKAQIVRAVIGNGNAVILFWSYILLPLSLAATFFYAAPIFVLIQSILFLKERVGVYRWSAVFAGFVGIAFITQIGFDPNNNDITLFALFIGILPAIFAASVHVSIRYLATLGEPAMTTIFYFSLVGTIGTGGPLLFMDIGWPKGLEVLIIGLGLCGLISQILKTVAYKYVEASLVAPFRYIGLIWSIILGYLFWDDIPTPMMIIGASIIVASNFVIFWREYKKRKLSTD